MLERIILHLDPVSIDPEYVLGFCKEYNMLTAYIFLSTRTIHQSFVNPLKRIFKVVKNQQRAQDKLAFGYKLFWYIRMCFRGETFPNGVILPEQHPRAIKTIVDWLLGRDHLVTLLDLDSSILFKVIWILFEPGVAHDIMLNLPVTHSDILRKFGESCGRDTEHFPNFALFIGKISGLENLQISKEICV